MIKEGQAQFAGETWADCVNQARKKDWKINKRKRDCICPACIKLGLKME